MLSGLNKLLYWLDSHFYHIGYNPLKNGNIGPDYRFGVVEYISVLIICVITCAAWSWLDRRRPSYNKLNYWFRVYLRYAVAIVMFGYGFDKLIPIQMSYPDAYTLLTPIGDQNHFNILWNFMGASPGYEMFTGICEITGSLLLLFRRTSVFGSLFMCAILINVVALNIFYNVSVKIFSSLLLVCVLFLLAPFFRKLIQLFFYQREISFAEKHYDFGIKIKNRLLSIFGALLIISILTGLISRDMKTYKKNRANREKIYDVTSFITKDMLPLNITDTLNWKRLVLAIIRYDTSNYAIIYDSKEEEDWY